MLLLGEQHDNLTKPLSSSPTASPRDYLQQQTPPSELTTFVTELARSDTPSGPTTAVSNQTAAQFLSEKPQQVLEPSYSNCCGLGFAFCFCQHSYMLRFC